MLGPFDPSPFTVYPTWAQGLSQGMSALAQGLLEGQRLKLQRQQFQLQQAEMGYQPAHQEAVYQAGKLAAPSMVSVGNVPTPTPGAPTTMGAAPSVGSPDAMARTTGQYKTVNVPGYYDLTKSLPYQTSLARVLEMQTRGEEAARIAAQSREAVAAQNNATKTNMFGQLNGYIGADGQVHYGMRTLGAEALSGFNNGQWVVDPMTGQRTFQPGVATQGKIVAGQPMVDVRTADLAARRQAAAAALATRQAALNDLAAHRRATENAAAVRAAQQAVDADARALPKPPPFGFLTPADSVAFSGRRAAAQSRLSTDQARLDSLSAAPSGLVSTPGARPFSSGSSVAPHVPRSGGEASALTPGGVSGAAAPTIRLGSRNVPNQSTTTRPTAPNLPKSPSDPTVLSTGAAAERARYNAAVTRIVENVKDPTERDRQLAAAAAIYKSRVGPKQ